MLLSKIHGPNIPYTWIFEIGLRNETSPSEKWYSGANEASGLFEAGFGDSLSILLHKCSSCLSRAYSECSHLIGAGLSLPQFLCI